MEGRPSSKLIEVALGRKRNECAEPAVLAATGMEVRNFTSLTPEQAALIRSRMKQTIKEGIEFGVGRWQKSLRQVAADPVLKQDLKEAVEYTAATWHREAKGQ